MKTENGKHLTSTNKALIFSNLVNLVSPPDADNDRALERNTKALLLIQFKKNLLYIFVFYLVSLLYFVLVILIPKFFLDSICFIY